ncbi:hypothetical protein Pfo_010485 [Paulownia fortunei]|nr:hypothetical protein Pfo_010485 [Paulownia fortunei]
MFKHQWLDEYAVQHPIIKKPLQMRILFENISQGLHPACLREERLLISPKGLQCLKRRLKLSWYLGGCI